MTGGGFSLLPAPPGKCPECAVEHEEQEPHDAQSLHYQYHFRARRGRWPTWKDAISHCEEAAREIFEERLKELGAWTEPESDVPDVMPTDDHRIGSVTIIKPETEGPS